MSTSSGPDHKTSERHLTAALVKLNIFAALKMMLFPMAVITLFWKDRIGLSLTDIMTVQVLFSATSVLMEYPSGYVSDRLGYRFSLVLACGLGVIGWGAYLVATSFWGVLLAEVVLGVSYAFISGSDTALLYETLRGAGRVDLYARCDGRMGGWAQCGEALGALAAGYLYARHPLLPFMAQIMVWLGALGLCLTLRESRVDLPPVTSHLTAAIGVCRYALLESPSIRTTIIFGTLLGLASFYMVWLVQPYMQYCQVPVEWFGPAWAGANAVVAIFSALSHRLQRRMGMTRLAALLCILVVFAYTGMALTASMGSFALYYLLTAMRGLQGPAMRWRLQLASDRGNRASILSLHSLVFRLGFVLTGPLVGNLADRVGFSTTFAILAVQFGLVLPISARYFLRHNKDDVR